MTGIQVNLRGVDWETIILKGLYREPQIGNPKNIAGISWNIRTLVGIFLFYNDYILGVPGLGFPVESL